MRPVVSPYGGHPRGGLHVPGTPLEVHTALNSPSLDFLSFISPAYDDYLIEGVDIALANNAADLLVQVGTGGGPAWDTGANYEYGRLGFTTAGSGNNDSGAPVTSAKLLKSASNNGGYGVADFTLNAYHLQSTVHRKILKGTIYYVDSTPLAIFGTWAAQWTTLATVATGLRFIPSAGLIASGSIRIYGLLPR